MQKNIKWLINFIMFNSNMEFETQDDFLIFLENKGIDYNLRGYEKAEIPAPIIADILERLNVD